MGMPRDQLETMWDGVKAAWGIVLGPMSAIMVGALLGDFSAGWGLIANMPAWTWLAGMIGLPVVMLITTFGVVLAIFLVIAILVFWWSVTWRVEAWLAMAAIAAVFVFSLSGGRGDSWQVLRILASCAVLVVPYIFGRVVPVVRYRRDATSSKAPAERSRRQRRRPYRGRNRVS